MVTATVPRANAPAKLILAGEFVCLDDAEADRLVQQGVAVYGEPDEETREIVEQADADGNEPEPHPRRGGQNAPQEGPQDLCGVNGCDHDRLSGNGNG